MKRIIVILAGIILLLGVVSCGKDASGGKLRIGIIKPSIDHLPLSLALSKGYLDADKIELIHFTSGWETQEAITAGRIDLAIMPFTYAWTAVEKGYKVKILSCLERETDGILTSLDITELPQLNGQRIGLLRASTLEILMQDVAKFEGISYEPVYFRTPTELVAALQSREVSAIVCYVPLIQKLSNRYHVLHWFAETYPGHPCCDLVATDEALTSYRSRIKSVTSAMEKAIDDISRPDAEVFSLLAELYGLDELQALGALKHTVFNLSLTEADRMFERRMMESFVQNGYLKKLPEDGLVYAR